MAAVVTVMVVSMMIPMARGLLDPLSLFVFLIFAFSLYYGCAGVKSCWCLIKRRHYEHQVRIDLPRAC